MRGVFQDQGGCFQLRWVAGLGLLKPSGYSRVALANGRSGIMRVLNAGQESLAKRRAQEKFRANDELKDITQVNVRGIREESEPPQALRTIPSGKIESESGIRQGLSGVG